MLIILNRKLNYLQFIFCSGLPFVPFARIESVEEEARSVWEWFGRSSGPCRADCRHRTGAQVKKPSRPPEIIKQLINRLIDWLVLPQCVGLSRHGVGKQPLPADLRPMGPIGIADSSPPPGPRRSRTRFGEDRYFAPGIRQARSCKYI